MKKTRPGMNVEENQARNERLRKLDSEFSMKKTGLRMNDKENWARIEQLKKLGQK